MTISVVIPTFNRIKEVDRAVQSVLGQNLAPNEIIIVDDCSSDGTPDFVRRTYPDIRVIVNQANLGGAVSRNVGIEAAQGEFVAFLDSDDQWLSNHLQSKMPFFKDRNVDGVFSSFYLGNDESRYLVTFDRKSITRGEIGSLILSNQRFDARTSTFIFRRECLQKVLFDPLLKKHQDWDLAINFDDKFGLFFDPNPTVVINVPPDAKRMSASMNHDATSYFLSKNHAKFDPNSLFEFLLKMLFRCERANDYEAYGEYMERLRERSNQVSWQLRVIYFLVRTGLIKPSLLRTLKANIINWGSLKKV